MNKSKCALAVAFTLGTALIVQGAGPRTGLAGGGRGGGGGGGGRAGAAATQRGSGPAARQRAATEAAEVTALRPAFNLLLDADHDYQGHRAKAMVAIAEACRMMGTDIVPPGLKEHLENAGDGAKSTGGGATSKPAGTGEKHATTEPELQTASDQQLQQALGIVQQVKNGIASGKQARVGELLDKAISDISAALAAK